METKKIIVYSLLFIFLGLIIFLYRKRENFDIFDTLDKNNVESITDDKLKSLLQENKVLLAQVENKENFGFYYPIYNTKENNVIYNDLRYFNENYGWVPYPYRYNNYNFRRYIRPDIIVNPYGPNHSNLGLHTVNVNIGNKLPIGTLKTLPSGRWVKHYNNYYYTWI